MDHSLPLSQDWEKKYIHKDWFQVLQENYTLEQVQQSAPHVAWTVELSCPLPSPVLMSTGIPSCQRPSAMSL